MLPLVLEDFMERQRWRCQKAATRRLTECQRRLRKLAQKRAVLLQDAWSVTSGDVVMTYRRACPLEKD